MLMFDMGMASNLRDTNPQKIMKIVKIDQDY